MDFRVVDMENQCCGNIQAFHGCCPNTQHRPSTKTMHDPEMETHPNAVFPLTKGCRNQFSWNNSIESIPTNMRPMDLSQALVHPIEPLLIHEPIAFRWQDDDVRLCSSIQHVCLPLVIMPNRREFDELSSLLSNR